MIEDASYDPAFAQTLEASLLADLRAAAPQGNNSRIDLALRGEGGALIGGLSGTTSYGWLRVNMIWVDGRHRREGHAHQLMQQACDLALERGCHAVWLETSNPDARRFYHAIGFANFAELANDPSVVPPAHTRWFLKAPLKYVRANR